MNLKTPILGCLIAGSALCASAQSAPQRPNIVWIFTDDHSYQTYGAYGGPLAKLDPTPNLDKIADEGMRFDRSYVENSICAPSRATLLTGKMSHMHGKKTNRHQDKFDHNQPQFQKELQKLGYETALVGKIHIPGNLQGFDYWEVLPGQGDYYNPAFVTEKGKEKEEGYVTDIITDKALDWMKNRRDKDKPFMLMIHHKGVHREWEPDPKHIGMYDDAEIPLPDTFFDDYSTRTTAANKQGMRIADNMNLRRDLKVTGNPEFRNGQYAKRNEYYRDHKPEGKDLEKWKYDLYIKDYLSTLKSVDNNVGRVLEALKEQGLDENTIVMYSSDQGFYMGEHGWFDKRFMYEESFRTPFAVRWPGKVKAGSVNADLVQNIDFAPTFIEMAGGEVPADMQGKSLVPLLEGKTPEDWRESLYYHYYEYPGAHSVRTHDGVSDKRYKLIRFYGKDVPNGEEWEFYDLETDPSELNNRYGDASLGKEIERLRTELARLRAEYKVTQND